ncbi:hypothetical protein COW36_02410 [bacterium (Candidatus Blackallbacteria) CG17_big_fil_post_rev_8_21_14_2_50_48_46]|uniref:Uncharacterized protein n=1 Tax=bacterium (Candidatus Blackallbacteria) CG17_big_fil_post_rev_8_21_14_2_50_48_46 TaxID=2014261 RepID=A0A2M7GA11_9BACT|nr:MAG: hypothetical protein COW64_13060 [bacterium (Candidatus Blackallbacteria) CG18_big_fil_WC_8_21_14_2_50_49_26]PIW18982.1 MAG: hypothetical protein COW36_02410 [bacterium (Candidatus Blackallbacteria) CG17_big_fil_post_rev_8_21_14_2_50_48_46]PIW44650.1 MAG: hypothetical protein COW20_23705 [bacterium (Candidatus Blackallbacteria) CG13_big_fil_rev_8_21_14_2_50_49_14]
MGYAQVDVLCESLSRQTLPVNTRETLRVALSLALAKRESEEPEPVSRRPRSRSWEPDLQANFRYVLEEFEPPQPVLSAPLALPRDLKRLKRALADLDRLQEY